MLVGMVDQITPSRQHLSLLGGDHPGQQIDELTMGIVHFRQV